MAEYKDLQPADGANETRVGRVWYEDQPPDSVNNAGRANEGMTSRFYLDNNGSLASTGSGGAYTVTINSQFISPYDGMTLAFTANHDSPGACTLNVNAPAPLPVAPIVNNDGTAVDANQIKSGSILHLVYKAVGGHYRITSASPPGVGSIDTNELADRAVTPEKEADGPTGAVRTYDINGRPTAVRGADNQVVVRRSGAWVAENIPGDEVFTHLLSPLVPGEIGTLDLSGDLSQTPDSVGGWYICLSDDVGYVTGERVRWEEGNVVIGRGSSSDSSYPNGIRLTTGDAGLRYYVGEYIYLPEKNASNFFTEIQTVNPRLADHSKWSFEIDARVYQSSLPTSGGGGGGTVNNAFSTFTDGAQSISASGEDTATFKSSNGTATIAVSSADNSIDIIVTGQSGAAPDSATYIVDQATAELPNSLVFDTRANTWIATKTTDDLAPSATRLYVTQAEKTQWNAAQANTVDSVFGLQGSVLIGSLVTEASPPDDAVVAIEKNDGTSWKSPVSAFTGGLVTAAYAQMAGTTGSAIAVGSDTFKVTGADSKVTVAVTNDDPTDGDVAKITIVEANLLLGNLGGQLGSDFQHGSLGGDALHAAATQFSPGFMTDADKRKADNTPLDTNTELAAKENAAAVFSGTGSLPTSIRAQGSATQTYNVSGALTTQTRARIVVHQSVVDTDIAVTQAVISATNTVFVRFFNHALLTDKTSPPGTVTVTVEVPA